MTANRCIECGAEGYETAYRPCAEKAKMDAHGVCFSCAYWLVRLDRRAEFVVIDGWTYSIGDERDTGGFRGFGGRRFDIEFTDGRRVTSTNLWAGSQVPAHFRERLPDDARFLGGAGPVQVGDITCWNSSRPHG